MKYNYVIIEDQKAALQNLQTALKDKEKYNFCGYACNISDATTLIVQKQPDLIFMDVELGKENSFKLIEELKNSFFDLPPIIMTTGHNCYAKSAVNNQITYFLSKPICRIELTKALRVFEKTYANLNTQLFVRKGKSLEVIKYADIIYVKADGGYTRIYLDNGRIITAAKSLKHFESKLSNQFMRVHRAYIINISKIKEIKLSERKCILEGSCQNCIIEIGKNYIIKLRSKLKI